MSGLYNHCVLFHCALSSVQKPKFVGGGVGGKGGDGGNWGPMTQRQVLSAIHAAAAAAPAVSNARQFAVCPRASFWGRKNPPPLFLPPAHSALRGGQFRKL